MKLKQNLLFHCLATVVGVVFWAFQGYIFGYAGIRWMTYVYIGLMIACFFLKRKEILADFKQIQKELKSFDKFALILILFGAVWQAFPLFGSGVRYSHGVQFFHVNGTDGVLHLGYIQFMAKVFPPLEPGINAPLVNYHYWSDLIMAELVRVWKLPVIHVFFQYLPPFIALFTGFLMYFLVRVWGGSQVAGRWALFLLFFAGDAAFVFMLTLHKKLGFNTPAIDNGFLQFLNVPHAVAKMVFIVSLLFLYFWIKEGQKKWAVLTIILFASLIGLKVYYGIFAALGLGFIICTRVIHSFIQQSKKKRDIRNIWHSFLDQKYLIGMIVLFGVVASAIYFPPNKSSGGLFFSPLEWPRIFLSTDHLNFEGWWLRRQVYAEAQNVKALLVYDAVALIIGLISIHGTRLLGFFPYKPLYKRFGLSYTVFLIPTVFIFNFLGLYTLQKSGLFNVFNFFVVSTLILALFSAFILAEIQRKKHILAYLFLGVFVLLTVPRVLHEFRSMLALYTTSPVTYQAVSNDELEALEYLRTKTEPYSLIQTHPANLWDQDAPYSVFFAQRSSYLTGRGLLATHNQPVEEKEKDLRAIFASGSSTIFSTELKKRYIDYVLLKKIPEQQLPFELDKAYIRTVFENKNYVIIEPVK